MSKTTLFTYLNQIQSKKRTVEYDKKIASAWMISQFLSHDKSLVEKVSKINKYLNLLPDKIIYEYFMDVILPGKRYIKWIKKRKKDVKLEERIKKLKENYPNMSTRECQMIISFLINKRKGK